MDHFKPKLKIIPAKYIINIISITESTLQPATMASTISLERATVEATSAPKGDLKHTM